MTGLSYEAKKKNNNNKKGVGRIQEIQDGVQWWTLLNMVMNLPGITKEEEYLDQLSYYPFCKKESVHSSQLFIQNSGFESVELDPVFSLLNIAC
jgi:hypothetical protein